MRLLLIGASGQLGRCIQANLAEYPQVSAVALSNSRLLNLASDDDVRGIVQKFKPHYLVNAAAFNAVDAAEKQKAKAYQINAVGPARLAKWAKAVGARLIHLSSDYVFDGLQASNQPQQTGLLAAYRPYRTSDAARPINAYGASKLAGECAVLNEDPNAWVIRTSWLFSEYGQNFVCTIIKRALAQQPLRVVSDQQSAPTSCHDLAHLLLHLLHPDAGLAPGLYHFAGQTVMSPWQWADAILSSVDGVLGSQYRQQLMAITAAEFNADAIRPAYSAMDSTPLYQFLKQKGYVLKDFSLRLEETVRNLLLNVQRHQG